MKVGLDKKLAEISTEVVLIEKVHCDDVHQSCSLSLGRFQSSCYHVDQQGVDSDVAQPPSAALTRLALISCALGDPRREGEGKRRSIRKVEPENGRI